MTFEIQMLAADALRPNDYNPNEMTPDEFAELVAEVRHLGRLPKPVVVRPNGAGFVIVDGEHSYRAALEAGLTEIPCEVIEADDFEAMRQTYKRNQHGQHNPVLQGAMFSRMMAAGNLSQRELAKAVELSEGTVRNSLEYVKALQALPAILDALPPGCRNTDEFPDGAVRSGYALFAAVGVESTPDNLRNGYATMIAGLTARQVRLLNKLPPLIAGAWLESGADIRALYASVGDPSDWLTAQQLDFYQNPTTVTLFARALRRGDWLRNAADFLKLRRRVMNWRAEVRAYTYGSFTVEELLPYFSRYWDRTWYVRDEYMFKSAFGEIIDTSGHPAKLLLTPEEWEEVFAEQEKLGGSHIDFDNRLKARVFDKTGSVNDDGPADVKTRLLRHQIAHNAPDFIKHSKLNNLAEQEALWKADGPEWKKRELAELERLPPDWRRQLLTADEDKATAEDPKTTAALIMRMVLVEMESNEITLKEEKREEQIEKLSQCHGAVLLAMHDILEARFSLRYLIRRMREPPAP